MGNARCARLQQAGSDWDALKVRPYNGGAEVRLLQEKMAR